MPFFQPAFFAPVQADNTAFANLFQLLNDADAYQRNLACETTCKPKQQQQSQQQQVKQQQQQQQQASKANKAQAQQQQKPQQKIQEKQPQEKSQEVQKQQQQHARHPLEDLFNSLQQSMTTATNIGRATAQHLPTFSPRFDVRETQHTYELHGELAGVDRNNVSLEFTEPQTLVVSGKVERNYSSGAATPVPAAENTPEAIADTHSEPDHDHDHDDEAGAGGARTPVDDEFTNIASPRSPSPARSHRATVTDEETEEALESGIAVDDAKETTAVVKSPAPAPAQAPAEHTERYWHRERSVGQFKRVFTFPVPVDEANVRASLENGILSVSVPKIKRTTRRIPVF